MAKKQQQPAKKKQAKKKASPSVANPPLVKAKLSRLDYKRISCLLLMGVVIRGIHKKSGRYKAWVRGFPHLQALAQTPASAYRRLFKLLRERGVWFP